MIQIGKEKEKRSGPGHWEEPGIKRGECKGTTVRGKRGDDEERGAT